MLATCFIAPSVNIWIINLMEPLDTNCCNLFSIFVYGFSLIMSLKLLKKKYRRERSSRRGSLRCYGGADIYSIELVCLSLSLYWLWLLTSQLVLDDHLDVVGEVSIQRNKDSRQYGITILIQEWVCSSSTWWRTEISGTVSEKTGYHISPSFSYTARIGHIAVLVNTTEYELGTSIDWSSLTCEQ